MKTLKFIFKTLLIGSIIFCLFPVAVFADVITTTYIEAQPTYYFENWSTKNAYGYYYYRVFKKGVTRTFIGHKGSSYVLWTVNDTTGVDYAEYSTQTLGDHPVNGSSYNSSMTNYVTVDNHQYSYLKTGSYSAITNPGGWSLNPDYPIVEMNSLTSAAEAVYYTFGDGAGEPLPDPVNWGSVRDPEYSTRIAGSGSAAKQNVDVLRWNSEYDTNGNDISECEIEIQAVPGSWSDSTLQGLLNQAVNAFNSSGVQPVTLDTVPAVDGLYNCSWQRIINTLNWNFDYLIARETQSNLWEKYGWYYRIRLVSPDGYEGQWQTLYTPLSSSVQDSETVINHNSFDMSVNQVYQNITQLNNNTSVTIVYNDTDYTVQNPDNGTEPTGGTNLWDILKELLNGIFQILAKLGDLIVGLVDGLFDLFQSLFTPPEVDQTVNNDINLNINNYITENQPGLQDQQLHLHQIFTDLETISSSYSNGGDCILTWENVSMDLSVFNAGTVTFIPGGTYDFKAAFMQLLAGFGMTYATYQMLVSGVIYILLFVLISHKVKGFLKKT